MKRLTNYLVILILLSGIISSCKKSTLDELRDREIELLDKYIADAHITVTPDENGLYYLETKKGTGTDTIKSGYKVKLFYDVKKLDSTIVMTSRSSSGINYEPQDFYVDVTRSDLGDTYLQSISGLHIGIKKMFEGGRATLIVPSELAFKAMDYSSIGIPRFSTLLIDVEVVKVIKP